MRKCILLLVGLLPLHAFSLPPAISPPGERMVLVDPRSNEWGAYTADGRLLREGMASVGKNWCPDIQSPCRTHVGTFRVFALGGAGCYSARFPVPNGGAPMPYCMYFSGDQALHGSYEVADAHLSHGCVRMHVGDAEWLRYNFVSYGTLVRVLPY